jgi:hypothetical protein
MITNAYVVTNVYRNELNHSDQVHTVLKSNVLLWKFSIILQYYLESYIKYDTLYTQYILHNILIVCVGKSGEH